jgi:hypothetical protein
MVTRFFVLAPALLFFVSTSFAEVAGGAESGPIKVELISKGKGARIEFNGKLFAQYLADGFAKPIVYPIIGPGGANIARNWPMKEGVANEATDHPHQKSLWYTHGSVSGVDFWAEGEGKGKIVPAAALSVTASGAGKTGHAIVKTANKWLNAEGGVVLTDEQVITFHLLADDERAIDYQVTLIASNGDVKLGDTKEGSMGIRTHPALNLKGKGAAGKAVNSDGIEGLAIWGKRAKWVDYWAPIEGNTVGVAIFDHPSNPRYPTHWHARDYGLIAANPFGIHEFEKKEKGAGDMTIKSGEKVTFKYRFLFHKGDVKEGKIAEKFEAWTK